MDHTFRVQQVARCERCTADLQPVAQGWNGGSALYRAHALEDCIRYLATAVRTLTEMQRGA